MGHRSTKRITKVAVDSMGPGDQLWDAEVKGFGVRCQKMGTSYVFKTIINGRQKWITIGRHGSPWTPDKAREEAKKLHWQILRGEDPTAVTSDSDLRIKELAQRYLDQYAIKKKASSARLDSKNIANHILPLIGNLLVRELRTSEVETFKTAVFTGKAAPKDPAAKRREQGGGVVVRGGGGAANRCLALLSKMMSLAELWGMRPKGSNPVIGVARYPEKPQERYLNKEELGRFGNALTRLENEGVESEYALAAFRLLILTGARRGEIQNLKWEHVHVDRGLLILPDSKAGPKSISLPKAGVALLKTLPRVDGNPYVVAGGKKGRPLANWFRPWTNVLKAAGLTNVRIHDLRHTYASCAIQNGTSLDVIGKLLGHSNTQTTKRYAHLSANFVQVESEKIGSFLQNSLESPPTSNQH